MKRVVFHILIFGISLAVSCSSDDNLNKEMNAFTEIEQSQLSLLEIEDLKILREEEKLARDVYLYAYNMYGNSIFNNISQSEQQHMDKLLVLLNLYKIDDPVLPTNGEYRNEELQTLYHALTAQVDISLVEALKVGATIEDLDINDIDIFEQRTDKDVILTVYNSLKCGSRNHMRSYYSQLLNNGVVYEAQFISPSELTTIIDTSNEQCGN